MDGPIWLMQATSRSLIAVQAGVSRKDMAVVTSTRKYEAMFYSFNVSLANRYSL